MMTDEQSTGADNLLEALPACIPRVSRMLNYVKKRSASSAGTVSSMYDNDGKLVFFSLRHFDW